MPLPYRTILTLPAETDLIALAEREVQTWIERKRKVSSARRLGFLNGTFFEPGVHDLGGGRTLTVARISDNRRTRLLLLRLLESNDSGIWQVDVVALDFVDGSQRLDTLIIEATRVDDAEAEGQVDPPGVVKQLLGEVRVLDGATQVTSEPRLMTDADVSEVYQAIIDPDRSVSVIVAASLGSQFDEALRVRVQSLTSKLIGVTAVFVLTRGAWEELNRRLPSSHAVEEGRVRTYLPRVDFADPADARRHRVLGPNTFAKAIKGKRVAPFLQAAYAIQTRGALLARGVPRAIRRQWALLDEAAAGLSRAAGVEQRVLERRDEQAVPIAPGTVTLADRVTALVKKWLHRETAMPDADQLDEIDDQFERMKLASDAVAADLSRAEGQLTQLQEQQDQLTDDLQYGALELVEAETVAAKLDEEVRRLRRALAQVGNAEAAYVPSQDTTWETPADLSELALIITKGTANHPAANRVLFTGDLDKVFEAQQRDQSGLYVQRCWEFVHVLFDYAELKTSGNFSGNVHSYLQSETHDGIKVAIKRHAPRESKQTRDQWGHERVFPVPISVNATGKVEMFAHFKAGQDNTFAPRMYYFDDTDGSGVVYVGYIGRHLTNTRTSNS